MPSLSLLSPSSCTHCAWLSDVIIGKWPYQAIVATALISLPKLALWQLQGELKDSVCCTLATVLLCMVPRTAYHLVYTSALFQNSTVWFGKNCECEQISYVPNRSIPGYHSPFLVLVSAQNGVPCSSLRMTAFGGLYVQGSCKLRWQGREIMASWTDDDAFHRALAITPLLLQLGRKQPLSVFSYFSRRHPRHQLWVKQDDDGLHKKKTQLSHANQLVWLHFPYRIVHFNPYSCWIRYYVNTGTYHAEP